MRLAAHAREADRPGQDSTRLAPQKDVLGDSEFWQEAQLLVDERHAFTARVRGARNVGLPSFDEDRALVIVEETRQHAHQRGLAGAVLANEAVDLAGVQIEIDAIDGPRRPEPHCDAAERHEALFSGRRCLDGMDENGGHGSPKRLRIDWVQDSKVPSNCRQDFLRDAAYGGK